jgi:hypothetical protein
MISNKEFIPHTKETLAKMGAAKATQFNPDVPLSFARAFLNAQIPHGNNIVIVNNPTDAGKKSITFKH